MVGSRLAADLLYLIPTFLKLVGGLSLLYLVIILLPLFIQIGLNMIISVVRSQFRIDIRPILDLILFPGSMLKATILWFVLTLHGYEYKLYYRLPDQGRSATAANPMYNGPGFLGHQTSSLWEKTNWLKLAFIMSLASYAVLPIFLILLMFGNAIITSLYLVLPAHLVLPCYNFMVISVGLGGLPVPQESMLILYAFLHSSPHLILNFIFNVIGTLIIGPYIGAEAAIIVFLVFVAIGLMMTLGLEPDDEEEDPMMLIMQSYIT